MQHALRYEMILLPLLHLCQTPPTHNLLTPLYLSNFVSIFQHGHTTSESTLRCFLFHMLCPNFSSFGNPLILQGLSLALLPLRKASPITLALWFSTRVAPTPLLPHPESRGRGFLVAGMTKEVTEWPGARDGKYL